jgi:hypothetical protein
VRAQRRSEILNRTVQGGMGAGLLTKGLKIDIQIYISLINYLKTHLKINTSPVPFPIAISGWVRPFRAPNLKIYGISWLRLSHRFLMFRCNGLL